MGAGDRLPPPGSRRRDPVAARVQGGEEVDPRLLGDLHQRGLPAAGAQQKPGSSATDEERAQAGQEQAHEMPGHVEFRHGHAEQNVGQPLQDRVVAGEEQVLDHRHRCRQIPPGHRQILRLERELGAQEHRHQGRDDHPRPGEDEQRPRPQAEEEHGQGEHDPVVDEDDRQQRRHRSQAQADQHDGRRPDEHARRGIAEPIRLGHPGAGREHERTARQDREQRRGATGEDRGPGGEPDGVGQREDMRDHHRQQGDPASDIESDEASGRAEPRQDARRGGRRFVSDGRVRGHAMILTRVRRDPRSQRGDRGIFMP